MMAKYDEKIESAMQALYDYLEHSDKVVETMPESQIKGIIADAASGGAASVIFGDFCERWYIASANPEVDDDEPQYKITEGFFRAADQILHNKPAKSEARGKTGYAYFKDRLLIALARKDAVRSGQFYDLKSVAEESSLPFNTGWVNKAAYEFRDSGYIQEGFTMGGSEDGNLDARLTGPGLEKAESLVEEYGLDPISVVEKIPVPAADRFVSLDHNSEPYKQAVDAVAAVIEAVYSNNEYGGKDSEDRDQRIAELKAGAELLKANRVEVSKIESVLMKTLVYLTGISVAVQECAAAIEAVKILLGL